MGFTSMNIFFFAFFRVGFVWLRSFPFFVSGWQIFSCFCGSLSSPQGFFPASTLFLFLFCTVVASDSSLAYSYSRCLFFFNYIRFFGGLYRDVFFFLLSVAYYCQVFFFAFSSCSCLGGKKEGTLSLSVVALDLPLSLLYCAFSLCTCKLTTSTTAAVLKVCWYCKER